MRPAWKFGCRLSSPCAPDERRGPRGSWPARPSDTAVVAGRDVVATEDEIDPRARAADDAPGGSGQRDRARHAPRARGARARSPRRRSPPGTSPTGTTRRLRPRRPLPPRPQPGRRRSPPGPPRTWSYPRSWGLSEQDALIKLGKAGLQPEGAAPHDRPDGWARRLAAAVALGAKVALGTPVTILVDRPRPLLRRSRRQPRRRRSPSLRPRLRPRRPRPTATTTAGSHHHEQPPRRRPPQLRRHLTPHDGHGSRTSPARTSRRPPRHSARRTSSLSIVFVPSEEPLGTVVSQGRDAGSKAPAKSTVQFNVSRGPGDKPMRPSRT